MKRTLLKEFVELDGELFTHLIFWHVVLEQCKNVFCKCAGFGVTSEKKAALIST